MNVLLDTNAYSALLRGNEKVLELLELSDTVYMSIIVIAELLSGFKGGNKEKCNYDMLNEFISNPKVKIINASIKTASIFSEIKHFLKQKGAPIPINDIWIAAHSYEYQATLLTFDNHFKEIPKISIWDFDNK